MEKIYHFYTLSSSENLSEIKYIGVTTTTLKRRLIQHRYCAKHQDKRGLPVHKWMYSVYQKGFDVIITKIDECNESQWEAKEQHLIKRYKDCGYQLMNLDKGGRGIITSEKRSKSSLERCGIKHRRPIIALKLNGDFFKEFSSISEAAKYFRGNNLSNISNVLRHVTKSAYGYIWIYKDKYDEQNNYEYNKDRNGKDVFQFDLKGNFIKKYDTQVDILKKFKTVSYNGLKSAIKNKKEYYNYFWSYNDNINIDEYLSSYNYEVIDANNNKYYFKYQREVANFVKINKALVQKYMQNNKKYIWNNYIVIRNN